MRLLLPLVIAVFAIALGVSAQSVNWVQYINPTDRNDRAFGVCLFGDYLAVVGIADGDEFVALLDRATGEVIKTWVGEGDWFYDCLSVGDRLYVVGDSVIYIFDMGLNVLKKVKTSWFPETISFDGSYLYLSGCIYRDVDGDGDSEWIWYIEKRNLDLDLIAYREFYRDWEKVYEYVSYAEDISINPATGDLWVVGKRTLYETQYYGIDYSLIVIFDKELNVKKVVEYPQGHKNYLGWLHGICFDSHGNACVIGWRGERGPTYISGRGLNVAKFDKNGNILAVNGKIGGDGITCVGGRVYVFGENEVGNYWRHAVYVLDENLNLRGELILNKGVEAHSYFGWGKPAFDGMSLYVTGWDYALGENNSRIVVYSISPQSAITLSPPPTQPADVFLASGFVALTITVVAVFFAVMRLRGRDADARRVQPTTQTMPRPSVGEASGVGDFCLEYQGEVITLSTYTVVGRRDFSGLPERVLAMIDERHFAVYYRDGVWWVEDLGSRHGTYLNGVRVKKERLREGDVISPGAAVAAVFKRCGTTRRVVPMEEGTKTY